MKDKGIGYFHSKEYHNCMKTLQLAERYFMQFENQKSFASTEQNQHLHDCLNFMASSAWNLKKYVEALQAGKRCYELRSTKNKVCLLYTVIQYLIMTYCSPVAGCSKDD